MKTNKQEVVERLVVEHTDETGLLMFGKYDHQEFEQAIQTAYEAGREEAIKECEGCVQKEQERIRKEMLRGYDDSYHHSSQKDGSTTYITEKQFDFILKEALLPKPNITSDE